MEAAVVSAAHGTMASLLGKLGELLTAKYNLLKEAKGQIMFLEAEFQSMHAFLKRISEQEEPNEQDKCWAKEVRELSYDIEDSVNEFMLRVEGKTSKPRGFKGFINRSMNLLTTMNARHEIAKEFEGLKFRVKEVSERRTRYKIDDNISKPKNTVIDLRLLALHAETANLVGVTGPRDRLIKLMDEDELPANELKVLSIVGFGGLGKTTLASEIYRKLEGQFQCRAFASVSQKPDIKKILRNVLSEVGFLAPEDSSVWEESKMISALREFLLDKRYFIVIDDIWDASTWNIIRCALPENGNGSRVIATTRIETVARACCAYRDEYIYKMKPLSDEDSKRLFFKRVFGSEDACPPYLKEVSAGILKKCGGLPLAIITTSSLLASQPNKLKEQWEYVRNSLGSNLEVNPSLEGMRQILNLSYINLPQYLKTCLLYLGIYPEDYTIHKNDLARQWVAEGFIGKVHGTDPEHVAKCYFNELINRSMIQPTYTDYNGEVMSCRVHDMMLDLILHKSREENFITVIDDIQDMIEHHGKIRRLSLHCDGAIGDGVVGSVQLSQIRTLARFGQNSHLPHFQWFKHLQVLRTEVSEGLPWLEKAPDFTRICYLFQLRYLKIITNEHIVLPSKIGGLQQLETFQIVFRNSITYAYPSLDLPSDIVHMSCLLHLIVPMWGRLPDGIGNMKSLRSLRNFELGMSSTDSIKGLRELTNMVDLRIRCSKNSGNSEDEVAARGRDFLHTCLEKLCNLKCLSITFSNYDHSCYDLCYLDALNSVPASFCHLQILHLFDSPFSRVPGWIGELHNLYDLMLTVVEVLEDDVRMLAQLASLIHLDLRIRGNDYGLNGQLPAPVNINFSIRGAPKDKMVIRGSGFPILKHFRVSCRTISWLTFEAGAMAKLERLEIAFSAWGWDGAAPAGIEHLSGLKDISASIEGYGVTENKRAAEVALRDAADKHPNGPTANIKFENRTFVANGWERDDPDK